MKHHYPGYLGTPSFCDLEVTVHPEGTACVVCTEMDDNPGTSVTNRAAQIATRVIRDNALIDPEKLTWLEHYPARPGFPLRPAWSAVSFQYHPENHSLRHPTWETLTEQEFGEHKSSLPLRPRETS